jgi:DDE superfamily endonuclease
VADRVLKHLISRARVIVENVIAGVKRCRIVKEVLRLTTEGIADLVMEIACGLHNLRVSCRHPFPTFDVLSLIRSG